MFTVKTDKIFYECMVWIIHEKVYVLYLYLFRSIEEISVEGEIVTFVVSVSSREFYFRNIEPQDRKHPKSVCS